MGSGKHKSVVAGINLVTLLWPNHGHEDGDKAVPCDYRIYDKANDGLSKNDHFRAMLAVAKERGVQPECVLPRSMGRGGWYASVDNLKALRTLGWPWLTRLPANRNVNLDRQGLKAVRDAAIDAAGTVVHLQKYGLIRVFKIASTDGAIAYWATSDLGDERPGHDRPEAAGVGRPLVDDRDLPPRPEAMLRRRAVAGSRGEGESATTSAWRSGPFCDWSIISTPPASVGTKPKPESSATPSACIWPNPCTNCRSLRKSYALRIFSGINDITDTAQRTLIGVGVALETKSLSEKSFMPQVDSETGDRLGRV